MDIAAQWRKTLSELSGVPSAPSRDSLGGMWRASFSSHFQALGRVEATATTPRARAAVPEGEEGGGKTAQHDKRKDWEAAKSVTSLGGTSGVVLAKPETEVFGVTRLLCERSLRDDTRVEVGRWTYSLSHDSCLRK